MYYVALGDSISIDDYTGVRGGGAASQFARRIGADPFRNLTRDGNVAEGVLQDLERIEGRPDLVTLTVGGNNLLLGDDPEGIFLKIRQIAERLASYETTVILNTVYDPTDGNDAMAERLGLAPDLRERFEGVNQGIREIAGKYGFILSDLEELFHGHGALSQDPWYVMVIEPNLAGATAIARHWEALLTSQ